MKTTIQNNPICEQADEQVELQQQIAKLDTGESSKQGTVTTTKQNATKPPTLTTTKPTPTKPSTEIYQCQGTALYTGVNSTLRVLAPLFVILAAIFWGILVVFVRAFGQADFKSMEIVTLRVYSSALFAWIFQFVFDRESQLGCKAYAPQESQSNRVTHSTQKSQPTSAIHPPKEPQETQPNGTPERASESTLVQPSTKFHIKDSWCFIGTGLISIVFFSYCYFRNVEVSSAAVAAILMYTSPIFVTLLSAPLFKEKITKTKLLALVLAIVGCALVSGVAGGISDVSPLGILLGLGSGIGYALYSIFGRFALNKGYSPFKVTALTFTFACVGVLPFINFISLCSRLINEPKYIALALAMGLIGSCTPFALYTLGLRYMEASKAAILATLEPIVTALVGTFFYKEPIDLFIITGIVMVLVAGILSSKNSGQPQKQ